MQHRDTLRRAAAPALFLLTLGLYLATLTQVHTFDALSYVTSVERKPWTEVFHPHHLAYGPLGVLAMGAGRALGFAGGAALPMQVVNALAGALGVALFFRVAAAATGRADLGLAAALLLGASYAYWYYAVEIEVYTVAALLLIVCLGMLLRAEPASPRRMALLGLAQAGAVLFHQTNALLCAAVLAWALAAPGAPRAKLRGLAAYGAALAAGVALPYLWVGLWVSRFRTAEAFADWMTAYARTGWWGGPLTGAKLEGLAKGLSETLTPWGGGLAWLALAAAAAVALAGGRGRPAPAAGAGGRPLAWALAVWLLVYGAFFLWWEPDNVEFWIASLPPALLGLALLLRRGRPWGPSVWLALAAAAALAGANGDAIRRRGDAATDLQRTIASELGRRSTPADLLVVPDGLQELYLPYYERRENFISLNQALADSGEAWGPACDALRGRIATARHAGAAVIIAEEALRPPALLLERHRIAQAQVDGCLAPFAPELRPLDLPAGLPQYWELPQAQALADGPGWRFDRSSEGWQAANAAGERFDGGWRLTPGVDPSLTGPLVRIDAARYRAVEVVLANGTAARDAQLFFIGEDGRADERRSLRWELRPGAAAETYTLDLRGAPGWSGVITRLRLDPVGVGDGGEVRVVSVRLVR